MVEETDEDGIDYVEAVAVDGASLLDHEAETYFARLGKLAWCLQAADNKSVMVSFCDPSLYSVVLDFNHRIERRQVRLTPMRNGGIQLKLRKKKTTGDSSSSLPHSDGHARAHET